MIFSTKGGGGALLTNVGISQNKIVLQEGPLESDWAKRPENIRATIELLSPQGRSDNLYTRTFYRGRSNARI